MKKITSSSVLEEFSGDYISWLRSFYQLAELRSFSRVAEVVGKSQSTITYQLKKLEKRHGTELINRRTTPLELTPDGERLYGLCLNLFDLLQEINNEMSGGEEVRGDIVIAANYGLASYFLPRCVHEFKQLYPQVSIEVRPQPIGEILKSYYAPDVDLLCTQQDVLPESAHMYQLFSVNTVLVTPVSWDITLSSPPKIEEFIHLPFIAFWRDYPVASHVLKCITEAGYSLNITQYAGFFLPTLMHVSFGRGLTIMDEYQARTPGFTINVHSLADVFPKRDYALVHSSRRGLSPAVQKFVNYMTSQPNFPYADGTFIR